MSTADVDTNIQDGALQGIDPFELEDWYESLEDVLHRYGPERTQQLLVNLRERAYLRGVMIPFSATTPYINTIHVDDDAQYPGDLEIEARIRGLVRWNAMAMVHRANKTTNVGGHISTFASSCTLYEVAQNHFFKGRTDSQIGDLVYFQGHASPGMYSRAFLEGRLSEDKLANFRQETTRGTGLSSYPHPWLMEDFWQFPTVSMGLGPICSIYYARFLRYLTHRGLIDASQSRVWAFLGDGEIDEPETLGAITLASRENLDNLTWVVNCNLQRLDGPVRANGKIVQELEGAFRGAGWNAIKVLWGSEWDPIFARDVDGKLAKRLGEIVDGQYQKYTVSDGADIRAHLTGGDPDLLEIFSNVSDEQLEKIRRGGHDPEKIYSAYKAAVEHKGAPTVILAHTVKGYGLGEGAEGIMKAHNEKKLDKPNQLAEFRSRFGIPIPDDKVEEVPFYRPPEDSAEMKYLMKRREELGGYCPSRRETHGRLEIPPLSDKAFQKVIAGSDGKAASTTFTYHTVLRELCRNKSIGKRIVPIIPDEARTFGMEGFFTAFGIYSSKGQLYTPVDAGQLQYYKEATDGQVLEEGISEAGSMASFIAAGTAYANIGIEMMPFYIYYSMFGFQRVGDLIWCAADSRAKGFLVGGTHGRTTLNGEGLQHEDGHSLLIATTVPTIKAYDPAYGYEVAVVMQDGMQRMYGNNECLQYYLAVYNEDYAQPAMPEGDDVVEGILKGMYKLSSTDGDGPRPQLFGSGTILQYALNAQEILKEKYGFASDVWSVTSYSELCRDAMATTRHNRLHPGGDGGVDKLESYLEQVLDGVEGPFIASSDNVRLVPDQIRQWVPGRYCVLGTDGFGRSDTREVLRRHFEIDAECIAYAALVELAAEGKFDAGKLPAALQELGIDPNKVDPRTA